MHKYDDKRAQYLALIAQGKSPAQAAKETGIPPAVGYRFLAAQRKKEKPTKPESTKPDQVLVEVGTVPDPGSSGGGAPAGSGAGGAEGARAAAAGGPKIKVEAERIPEPGAGAQAGQAPPFGQGDPAEVLIIISKFATAKLARTYCLVYEVEWDPKYGEWTKEEEAELRMMAPGAAFMIAGLLVKYGIWLAPILYLGTMWEVLSVRLAGIKKVSPKKKGKRRGQEEEEDEDLDEDEDPHGTVPGQPTPNGDHPVRTKYGFRDVVKNSFWAQNKE